jgi:multidrug resistance efflux pump
MLKEQHLAAVRHELTLSQAAVAEAENRESTLQSQLQSLQLQLNQKQKDFHEQKSIVSSPALLSPNDSTALEVSARRTADVERKCVTTHVLFLYYVVFCLILI